MKILAIDLGKFNCVSCLFNTETNTTEFETIKTYRIEGGVLDKGITAVKLPVQIHSD